MELSERIKVIREELGYSQKDMANAIDASLASVQNYESGKSVPGGDVIKSIVKLGFNANWLLTGEGEMRISRHLSGADRMAATADRISEMHNMINNSLPEQYQVPVLDEEASYRLLRDIIECYRVVKPDSTQGRMSRDIVLIYRHFLKNYSPSIDEVEITEYIENWL